RASNSELVEPLPEPERTLNRRLRRRNRRVQFDQRNNPPQHPRIVYPPILNINYFCHFLDILQNYDPIDDEPMWVVDRVVAPTTGSAITIPETVTPSKSSSSGMGRVGKVKGNTYNVLPWGPVYEAILKKKITKKEDVEGNFEIPCSIGGLKHVNALVDQGSDVNVMPYSTCMKLIDKMPAETDIRLSLASHSYVYPLGIVEDVLVEVVEHVYLVDFVILDIKENKKRPFIL
ncbi:reverse transcriptase domain-containing protein, partial [Tanacetum coccineum]